MGLFINYLSYAITGFGLLFFGLLVFLFTTKTKELKLVAEKNTSAALSIGGKMLGLAFVIGSSITNSLSLLDMVIWGLVGIATQVLFYFLSELVTINFSIKEAIEEDNRAVGTLLLLLSLSIGWIVAQCLTY